MEKEIDGRKYRPLVCFRNIKKEQKAKQSYLNKLEKEKYYLVQNVLNMEDLAYVPCENLSFLGEEAKPFKQKRFHECSFRDLMLLDVSTLNEMLFYPEEYFTVIMKMLTQQEKEVLMYRSQKYTLQDIGEQYALSRERIRQIQNNALELFDHFIHNASFYLFSKDGFLDLEQIEAAFSSEAMKLIYFIFEEHDAFKYDEDVQKIVMDSQENEAIIAEQIDYLSSKNYVQKRDISHVLSFLEKKGIQYYDFHDLKKKLLKDRFYQVGDTLVKMDRVAAPYLYVIKEFYPDGIELKQMVETDDFRAMLHQTKQLFPIDTSQVNVRQLVSRLTPELKAIDRSLWLHEDHFYFDRPLIHQIVEDLKASEKESFYFPEIFNIYEKELRAAKIYNRYHLRTALEEVVGDSFEMNRDVIKKTGAQFVSLDEQIENYLKDKQKSVFLEHIKQAFRYHSETMVYFALSDSPNILRWGYSRYIHKANVAPLKKRQEIASILSTRYEDKAYFSVSDFIEVVDRFNDFSAYEIYTKEDITYFLDFYFKHEFAYDNGVIWFVDQLPQQSIERVQSILQLENDAFIDIDALYRFSQEYKLSYNESRYLIETVFYHCIRHSKTLFYAPKIQLETVQLEAFRDAIKDQLSSAPFVTIAEIFDKALLPAAPITWTVESIVSILKKDLSESFDVFSIGPDKMLSTWGIVSEKGRFESLSDAVYAYFFDLGYDEIYEHELDRFLHQYKISPYGIPHEFYQNKKHPIIRGKIKIQ